MRGWNKQTNRGVSGARKKQTAAGDHSTRKVRQKHGAEAKKTSMAYGKLQAERPVRDNIGGVIKAPRKGDM